MSGATTRLYLADTYRFEAEATVVESGSEGMGRSWLVADRTVFYAKGGGQPGDRGTIRWRGGVLAVDETLSQGDRVVHGSASHGPLPGRGEPVQLSIDREARLLHARLHTAGELICAVMWEMGYTHASGWPVVGAIHYPERAGVDFQGTLLESERAKLASQLERRLNERIAADDAVELLLADGRSAAAALCGFTPDYLPERGEVRVVRVGAVGRPCAGTHVARLGEIGELSIRKIKSRKGVTTVSYQLSP